MSVGQIEGPTMLLGSGSYFNFVEPNASAITLEDLAFGLAFESRWNGQCVQLSNGKRVFYSVAQHCVVGSAHCLRKGLGKVAAFAFLMHEAGEFALGDMCGPAKAMVPQFKEHEKRIEAVLLDKWKVPEFDKATLKHIDLRMMATERRDLMNWAGERWAYIGDAEPFQSMITPWSAHKAAKRFIDAFNHLAPIESKQAMRGAPL